MRVTGRLKKILATVYPCPERCGACRKVRYAPRKGLLPRGYTGAFGGDDSVKLIICLAEPGEPGEGESYNASLPPRQLIDDIANRVADAYRGRISSFHRNVCFLLEHCWPNMDIEEQLQRTWITETTLCSAPMTTGPVAKEVEKACALRYLTAQLKAFPDAFIIAMGKKAEKRLRLAGYEPHVCTRAAGRPIGNRKAAEASWKKAGAVFRKFIRQGTSPRDVLDYWRKVGGG